MTVSAGKLAGGLLVLVGVWIAVYWLWEPREPRITFSSTPAPASGAPDRARPPVPEPVRLVVPPPAARPAMETPVARTPARETAPVSAAPADHAVARPAVAVKPPEFWEYTVSAGETLQTISRHFYGSPDFAGAIARANPLMDPTKLRAGKRIRIPKDQHNIQGLPQTDIKPAPGKPAPATIVQPPPAQASRAEARPQAATPSRRTYKVQEGDTLSEISQQFYGTHARARLIYEANRDKLKSENDLRIGAELVIPDAPAETKGR